MARAFKVVANAIPCSLLRTVYERVLAIRTYLHGHGNWSLAGCPDDVPWDQDHVWTGAVSHQFVSDETAEAERTRATPFPSWSSRSSVGDDLPFDEGTLRAFRCEMWNDDNIYTSHLGDEPPQPRRLNFPVSKAKQATPPS